MQTWSYDEDEEEDYEDEDAEEEAVVNVAKTFTKEEDATEAPPIETKDRTHGEFQWERRLRQQARIPTALVQSK